MRYQIDYTNPKTGATSPIESIERDGVYTAEMYIKDCKDNNAAPEWVEMIESGTVTVIALD